MRIAIALVISLACGAAAYIAGAVGWSLLDPNGAGRALLFTIPIALVVMAVFGLLATLLLVLPFGPRARRRAFRKERAKSKPASATPTRHPLDGEEADDVSLAAA
jgi:TRAP-type C4-dicarboxylate transport system permease small subunit